MVVVAINKLKYKISIFYQYSLSNHTSPESTSNKPNVFHLIDLSFHLMDHLTSK